LCGGESFPQPILSHPWAKDWYPEDFTYAADESAVAKETHELERVLAVARELGVIDEAMRIGRLPEA
jgi:hypothetical protein